jgi:rhamnose transport system permease protein
MKKKYTFGWDQGVTAFLAITVVVGSFVSEYFANFDNLSFVIQDIAEIAIIALAMTYLIIAGEIDLSVASMLSLRAQRLDSCSATGHLLS